MKVMSFSHAGRASWGVVGGTGVIDMGRLLPQFPTLRAALAGDALAEVARRAAGRAADFALAEITYLPTITDPEHIICIGLNYELHRQETGAQKPANPMIFARFTSSQVGHGGVMLRPKVSERFDWEGELAVIIGTGGRYIDKHAALSHVAGYACYNDGSIRDFQRHTTQFHPGKNFPGTGAFGPWMTTADEIPDPSKLMLTTRVNGVQMQHSGTDDLIYDVPTLISYCSQWTKLEPGDVIVTGTPSGVGMARTPPVWMKHGDIVEVEISQIGVLRNPVLDE